MFSIWANLLITIVCLLLILEIRNQSSSKEGLNTNTTNTDFEQKHGDDIYDTFYAGIYDQLVYNENKNDYEVESVVSHTHMNKQSSLVLDVGCGTGHHVALYASHSKHVTGLDSSKSMIEKCKAINDKNVTFVHGNALNTLLFQPNSFTHIVCNYFTLYYIKDKALFFNNCYRWLQHNKSLGGGYLIVHIVDRDNFDPVVPPSSPFFFVNPQTFAQKRITTSSVVFDNFVYKAEFSNNNNNSNTSDVYNFVEKFENKETGKVFRKNEHRFYMESEEAIVEMAKNEGFIVDSKIDLLKAAYEYQYLYVFKTSGANQVS
jgi:SAM-dependent methyltransferase